ncbi:MAG: tRNA pseudouridine(55) synthase TruB [Propionibacteriales bacterium]|nr:tRNA pseudouridine(55) synthase TruB [Propionibacteriales bacterium]
MATPDGLLIVDKDSGWTSHDVVARIRHLAATRRVGHAGTLDPMATGVLVLGIGRATRLLGHLALATKAYDATIRLGQTTVTDDAEGDVVQSRDVGDLPGDVIEAAIARQRGDIEQVPSAVSAIKVKGQRAYKRVRAGEGVVLPSRSVHIARFDVVETRREGQVVDLDVRVECSSGTYIRALARDVGAVLGVGGHLTRLRRTRVGGHGIDEARSLETLALLYPDSLPVLPIDVAVRLHFDWYVVADTEVPTIRNGRPVAVLLRPDAQALDQEPAGSSAYPEGAWGAGTPVGPVAVLAPGGEFLALYEQHGPMAKAVAVFAPPAS